MNMNIDEVVVYVVSISRRGSPATGGRMWEEDQLPADPARPEDLEEIPETSRLTSATHYWGSLRVRLATPAERAGAESVRPDEPAWRLMDDGRPCPPMPRYTPPPWRRAPPAPGPEKKGSDRAARHRPRRRRGGPPLNT